ncbi:MAG: hypothetical protein L0219_21020, partial [Phycisphaerales bacterium]|nr:hypothetical protein [Phycisphaerales bacterium]
MKSKLVAFVAGLAAFFAPATASDSTMARPKAGPVQILKVTDIKPGMQATAWTVFTGTEPEAVPIEIVGLWRNVWGPKQDVILGKMGGKAMRTNVAKGMSGSPVYVDGKLIGALSLGFSMFSPDAICGITPIELMLEIDQFDQSRPADARTPDSVKPRNEASLTPPGELLAAAGLGPAVASRPPLMTPIETPLTFAGFSAGFLDHFGPMLQQMGVSAVQGGAGGSVYTSKPAPGWQSSLQPGEPIAGVLVSGDMSVTGLGTVTYNDGKKVLGFGHPFFNLGPVSMPMSKGEILMVMSSQFQPYKMGNATEIAGALTQDRHSGILGELGKESPMIPVSVNVRSFTEANVTRGQKQFKFNVFVHQKWTPF